MPIPAWTYSDWITFETGNASRLSRLRLHIREVSDEISTGSFAVEQKSHDKALLQAYLSELLKKEAVEATAAGVSSGTRAGWTRGKAAL